MDAFSTVESNILKRVNLVQKICRIMWCIYLYKPLVLAMQPLLFELLHFVSLHFFFPSCGLKMDLPTSSEEHKAPTARKKEYIVNVNVKIIKRLIKNCEGVRDKLDMLRLN